MECNPELTRSLDMRRMLPLLVLLGACATAASPRVLGTDSTGKLAPGGIGPETKQALENVKAALERNGLSMDRVVKCTAMLADIGEWAAMNAVYVTYFPGPKPARSAFGTNG